MGLVRGAMGLWGHDWKGEMGEGDQRDGGYGRVVGEVTFFPGQCRVLC
jgi:hypothetical protein